MSRIRPLLPRVWRKNCHRLERPGLEWAGYVYNPSPHLGKRVVYEYIGPRSALVACRAAESYMFENIGKFGQKSGMDEYGDRYAVYRYANDYWRVERTLSETSIYRYPKEIYAKSLLAPFTGASHH